MSHARQVIGELADQFVVPGHGRHNSHTWNPVTNNRQDLVLMPDSRLDSESAISRFGQDLLVRDQLPAFKVVGNFWCYQQNYFLWLG
jgi:hypothetical protein